MRDQRQLGVENLRIMKFGYWEFISQETERVLFPHGMPNWELEHAAVMETSLMLHLRPDLVRSGLIPDHPPAQFPPYEVFPFDTLPIPPDGALSSARPASAAKGKLVIEQIVPDISEALRKAVKAGARCCPASIRWR